MTEKQPYAIREMEVGDVDTVVEIEDGNIYVPH